jgi:hypothetical protein
LALLLDAVGKDGAITIQEKKLNLSSLELIEVSF